ncbi:hypothetical protein [Flavitalea sp.]|nr:hypothetical protein [Flavitalea sp.]
MRYVKYAVLVILIGVGLLDLVYVLFRKGYNKYNSFEQTRLTEIINGNTGYDILFIGSSRTYYHVNPNVIDTILKLNSYNAGIDGANVLETNLILKCYLASHPAPKYVIADFSTPAFEISSRPFFNPNIYFPFLNNKIVSDALKPYKRTSLLRYLPFLQITECDDLLREGAVLGLTGREKPLDPNYKGYLESGKDTLPLPYKATYLRTDYTVEQHGKLLLQEIIDICKEKGIRLFITYSPIYKLKDEKLNSDFFPTLHSICNSNKIPFLNYRTISLTNNNRMFRDEIHLNHFGADIFSKILAGDLNRLISNDPNRLTGE